MIYESKPSFRRSWKNLPLVRQEKAKAALDQLTAFLEGGPKPLGLGLKKLRSSFWEIRTNLKDRILFTLEKELVSFVLIGNHDDIHRALKRA